MTEHVSALDATFLELEEADESAHMHIGGILVFEPLGGDGAPPFDRVRSHLDERLAALPRYHQRLSQPHTGGLGWPAWEADPDFDIDNHLHRAAVPAPGGEAELTEWLGEFWSHRLDRRRPLWDMVMLEGLEGGRWALATKTHHCMVDGVGSIDAGHLMLDATPEPGASPPGPPPQQDDDEEAAPLLWGVPGAAAAVLRTGAGLVRHPGRLGDVLSRSRALAELIVREEVVPAPQTSLNVPIGTRRRFEVARVPLAELKAVKSALGGTVNDVVLAVAAGGLRRMLAERGEALPGDGLRAMVPVNVRSAGERLALGNRITSLFVQLPVDEESASARYGRATEAAESLKAGTQALGAETLLDITAHAPPVVHSALARSLYASRLFNVTITNVPGPQMPLYALGSRLVEVAGLVPLAAEHSVGIAVLSYDGMVTFGLIGDRDAARDLAVLRAGIEDSIEELRALAGSRRSSPAGGR